MTKYELYEDVSDSIRFKMVKFLAEVWKRIKLIKLDIDKLN